MLVNLKEILKIAEEKKIAIGMFNATGFDSLQAVIAAAEELDQPVIIAHAEVHNVYNDIDLVGPAMIAMAKNAKVPVCVHLDHGTSLEMIWRALRIGFTSVMIDASALPYEENLRLTKQVTEAAHAMNVSVEAELGRLVTGENGEAAEGVVRPEDFYTAQPKLDFDVVKNVAEATGLPLVMHGGSGVSEDGFRQAIANGIRKINYYSYMSKAGYEAAKAAIESGKSSIIETSNERRSFL